MAKHPKWSYNDDDDRAPRDKRRSERRLRRSRRKHGVSDFVTSYYGPPPDPDEDLELLGVEEDFDDLDGYEDDEGLDDKGYDDWEDFEDDETEN
jgi:hypothetical protein